MTPNGEIYFHPTRYLADFSIAEDFGLRHWFMHEMTHVWQYQLGFLVKTRGAIRLGLSYEYELTREDRLGNFNMEAQGDLLADYYVLKYLDSWKTMAQKKHASDLKLYEEVLSEFFADRRAIKNLPSYYSQGFSNVAVE